MDRQTLRDWVHRFNAEGPDGLKDIPLEGPSLAACARATGRIRRDRRDGAGPDQGRRGPLETDRPEAGHQRAVRRCLSRAHDRQDLEADRLLAHQRETASSRPEDRDHRGVQKNFPATLKAHLAHIPKRKPIEIWFQDEARIGQKNGVVRQWARRGTRPRQPADQRYENAYLFGAICPARGVGAALAMPYADTEAMQLHIDEIARTVARGRSRRSAARPRRLAHDRQARRSRKI